MKIRLGQYPETFLNGTLAMLAVGILCAALFPFSFGALLALTAAAFLAAGILLWRESKWTWAAFLVLFLLLGAGRYEMADSLSGNDISRWAGETGEVTGTLRAAPRLSEDTAGVRHIQYEVEAEAFRGADGETHPASGGIIIHDRLGEEAVMTVAQAGDRIRATGKIRIPRRYNNPGQIDSVRRLRAQGITARLSVRRPGVEITPTEGSSLLRWAEAVRRHYLSALRTAMPQADAAALFALLFGGYEGIRPELTEAFVATGIVHILSVSGSHISLLAAVMAWLGGFLRLPRLAVSGLVITVIAFYSLLAGLVPPVVRSAVMGSLTFAAVVLEREKDARRILTVTGLGMLLIQPFLLFDISFQLSFAATAGLLYLTPRFRELLAGWPEFFRGGLSITLAAQLAALPFLAWYFNQISFSSLLANLTVVPLLEFMMIAALGAGILAWICPLAGRLFLGLDSILLGLTYELSRFMARLPGGVWHIPSLGFFSGALYYAVLTLWGQGKERRKSCAAWILDHRGVLGGMGALVLAGVFIWQLTRPAEMKVHFIDVHQGNAALVVTPHGRAFMIDTGGVRDNVFDVGARVDLPYLRHYGVWALDFILLTHAHEDHAAGAGSLLRHIPVGFVWTGHEPRTEYARNLGAEVQADLTKLSPAREGSIIDLDGVRVEILHAPENVSLTTGNEASNVYRVSYGNTSFLFTGDLVKEQEAELLKKYPSPALESTVLQVPHHGSATSSSPAFVATVHPVWAVFSVGADNSFGHPRPEIVKRFHDAGAAICRTDEDGAIVFSSDGTRLRVERYCDAVLPW